MIRWEMLIRITRCKYKRVFFMYLHRVVSLTEIFIEFENEHSPLIDGWEPIGDGNFKRPVIQNPDGTIILLRKDKCESF